MASIAIMIGGAVLNAAAFTGGNYLAKYLAGDDGQAALAEKTRHDKALEAYQAAMAKYTRERTQLLDWIETNREIKAQANQNSTTRPTPNTNCRCPQRRNSQTCISQVGCKNRASFFLSAAAR